MSRGWVVYSQAYAAMQANVFLSLLRKIPLLGALLPRDIYKRRTPKYIAGVFGVLLGLFKTSLAGNLSVFVFVHQIPAWLGTAGNKTGLPNSGISAVLFLIISALVPAIYGSKIFKSGAEDYTFLNHFMVNPLSYYRYKTVKDFIIGGFLLLPVLIYLFRDVSLVLFLLLAKLSIMALGHAFFLSAYKKRRRIMKKKKRLILANTVRVAAYILLSFGVFANITLGPAVQILAMIASLAVLGASAKYLIGYRNFKQIAVQYANKDTISLNIRRITPLDEDTRGVEFGDLETNKTFFAENKNKNIWSFMDAAFRRRYKKTIRSSYLDKSSNNLIFGLFFGLLIRFGIINLGAGGIMSHSPKVIPFAFSMAFGFWYLPMCFRHMDLPLLYNNLYSPHMIARSMVKRYLFLLRNGAFQILSLAAGLFLLLFIGGIELAPVEFFRLCLAYTLIYLIYETYHVIVYYLLQPYTNDLTVKNPVFSALSLLESTFGITVLFTKSNVTELLQPLAISFVILLLIFAATVKLAPKTFKLRFSEDTPLKFKRRTSRPQPI